jgi:hypothetical protein
LLRRKILIMWEKGFAKRQRFNHEVERFGEEAKV